MDAVSGFNGISICRSVHFLSFWGKAHLRCCALLHCFGDFSSKQCWVFFFPFPSPPSMCKHFSNKHSFCNCISHSHVSQNMGEIWKVCLLVLVQCTTQDVQLCRVRIVRFPARNQRSNCFDHPTFGLGPWGKKHVEGVCQSATCKVIRGM